MSQHQYDPTYISEWQLRLSDGNIRRWQIRAAHGRYFQTESGHVGLDAACLEWPELSESTTQETPFVYEKRMVAEGKMRVLVVKKQVCAVAVAALTEAKVDIRRALRDTGYFCEDADFGRDFKVWTRVGANVEANHEDIEALIKLMPSIDPARVRPLFEHESP